MGDEILEHMIQGNMLEDETLRDEGGRAFF